MKGRIDGLRFGGTWLVVAQQREGVLAATQGRALDHLGWRLPRTRRGRRRDQEQGREVPARAA